MSSELRAFLSIVDEVAGLVAHTADTATSDDERWAPVASAGLWTLARDTIAEPDAPEWLGHVVRTAARRTPALGFVLAGRYAADLCFIEADEEPTSTPTFALEQSFTRPVVATSPTADAIVVLNVDAGTLARTDRRDVQLDLTTRTGLTAARLANFGVPSASQAIAGDTSEVLARWEHLVAAALIGVAERAVELTSAYVLERRQFGVPIGSFAGLRALVAGMSLRVEPIRAQLDQALQGEGPGDGVAALAGRAAVDNCLDAIQSYGGYGYIDEYPVAGLLRDAISLQARSGGRRLHVARVATRGLGVPAGSVS